MGYLDNGSSKDVKDEEKKGEIIGAARGEARNLRLEGHGAE